MSDRISNLPDDILYQIISSSSLSMKDIACLSSTSRRFGEICISNPHLTFDSTQRRFTTFKPYHLSIYYVSNFLAKRKKMMVNKEINRFELRWQCSSLPIIDERLYVESWIHEVLDPNFNLQELLVDLKWSGCRCGLPFVFPFNSSLKHLELKLRDGVLEFPRVNSGSIPLETLSLTRAKIPDSSNLRDWISKSCKRLKTLVLKEIYWVTNLEIMSECIENLTLITNCIFLRSIHISALNLKELTICWMFHLSDNKGIKLHAPNLEVIDWDCYALDHCDLGLLKSLKSATISLSYTIIDGRPSPFDTCYEYVIKLLQSFQAAKFLTLNSLHLEVLLKENNNSIIWENLENLRIEVVDARHNNIVTSATSLFLNRAPNLKTISTFKSERYGKKLELIEPIVY